MLLPKPCQRRRPAPKAEGLQEGEVPRGGGDRRGKRVGESIPEGGRKGGDSRGKRAGESIPDGWRPEASPPAGLCLCLCERQTERDRERDRQRDRQRDRERGGERQREKERRGRESDRESESQEEGGKKEESLYLTVGGQRAWTTLRGIIEIQKSA